jgi:large subunit ribosomal protein L23
VTTLDRSYGIIKKPVITEKASDATGIRNAYTFRVPLDANKVEVRQAVQQLFEVKVKSVNTLRVRGKWRVRGRSIGRSQPWKKAIVILGPDDKIDVL